jgi:hypothetical protein
VDRELTIGRGFDRTVVTSSIFEYLRPLDASNGNLVAQIFPRWNRLAEWLSRDRHFENAASKLYRQMYANTGIATDSARVSRATR